MSSVYRKGRDGYFYYQAYIDNPKTNKKDKRVFHALNTKNKDAALSKKIELDKHYKNKKNPQFRISKNNLILSIFFASIVSALIVVIMIYQEDDTVINKEFFLSEATKVAIKSESPSPIKEVLSKKMIEKKKIVQVIEKKLQHDQKDIILSKLEVLPKYQIANVKMISKAFSQVKISLVLNNLATSEEVRLLCLKIMKDHSQFSNFIICIYNDSVEGTALAHGDLSPASIDESNSSLIALFTYNKIEGEFFDFNSKGYNYTIKS